VEEIGSKAKTIRELLKGVKYSVDSYQREYKWQDRQIRELIQDLSDGFLSDYRPEHERKQVARYGKYFLGSIIISRKDESNFIVDGQQRLTSLTLLLIYLRNLQKERADKVNIDEMIFSEQYGTKSFNLTVDERQSCMEALFEEQPFDDTDRSESVRNILARYRDIEDMYPVALAEAALPYFIDWMIENVFLVEIRAASDDDAYTIFETMNDRGLPLSPTEMLKGFLLANIDETNKRNQANTFWKGRIQELVEHGKEADADCFKTWLRSQYATKIRERKEGAKPEDFDRIGTEFHRWFREHVKDVLQLNCSDDFFRFIDRDFDFYSRQFITVMRASTESVPELEHILYNAHHGFTLQNLLLLAPLRPSDSEATVLKKLRLVALYVNILIAKRIWNFKSIDYSTMQYAMFNAEKDIRSLEPVPLAHRLAELLSKQELTFSTLCDRLYMHQQNRKQLHRILARIADYIERESGNPPRYLEYVLDTGSNRYEVEHVWANRPDRHTDEFDHPNDFLEYRNRIGGLLLLPKKFNASFGDLPYSEKVKLYNTCQTLLARSLHEGCYTHNPGFIQFIERTGLPFVGHSQFKKADLDARGQLYVKIAERIWDPDQLLAEVR
jgi:uncharacterized protein with ParB-like and HNH nuclease domain